MVNIKKSVIKVLSATDAGVEVTKASVRKRAYGSYRACCSGIPYLVFQGYSVPYGTDPGSVSENTGKVFTLLTILYWIRLIPDCSTNRSLQREYQDARENMDIISV